jgi:hypothetical protein
MAVVEYKHHVFLNDHRRHIPGFITNGELWHNSANHSFVGWVKEDADYYVPWSTLKVLSKEDIVQRLIAIHNVRPIRVIDESNTENPSRDRVELTSEAEVRAFAEQWYDNYVAQNTQ